MLFLTISRICVCVCRVVWFVCVHRYGSNRFLFFFFYLQHITASACSVYMYIYMCVYARAYPSSTNRTHHHIIYIYILYVYVLTYNTYIHTCTYIYIYTRHLLRLLVFVQSTDVAHDLRYRSFSWRVIHTHTLAHVYNQVTPRRRDGKWRS